MEVKAFGFERGHLSLKYLGMLLTSTRLTATYGKTLTNKVGSVTPFHYGTTTRLFSAGPLSAHWPKGGENLHNYVAKW